MLKANYYSLTFLFLKDPVEKSVVMHQVPKILSYRRLCIYSHWGSLLTDETSFAEQGLQGSPQAMLDSALQQGIGSTSWDGGVWTGLNLSRYIWS